MNPEKRLHRSNDAIFAGVCGGIAEYFDLDPTLIRILTVFIVLAGLGLPILAYLVAIMVMPKQDEDYSGYIDVQPTSSPYCSSSSARQAQTAQAQSAPATGPATGQATGQASTMHSYTASGGVTPGGGNAAMGGMAPGGGNAAMSGMAPGGAYTTCNPCAYDAAPSEQQQDRLNRHRGIQAGIILGVCFMGVGLIALFGTFLNVSAWLFWPLIVVLLGFILLCSPGEKGWSLARAGRGIACVAMGISLLFWTLGIISLGTFWLTFIYLWPVLLIVIGLSVIGSATKQTIFKLFGSLLFSVCLLIGVWSFGQIGSRGLDISVPGGHTFSITFPSSPNINPQNNILTLNDKIFRIH